MKDFDEQSATFTQDSRYIFSTGHVYPPHDQATHMRDARTGKRICTLRNCDRLFDCSPDGKHVVGSLAHGHLRTFSTTGEHDRTYPINPTHASFSPCGRFVAVCSYEPGIVCVFCVASGALVQQWSCSSAWSLHFSPDGMYLAICQSKNTLSVWSLSDRREVARLVSPDPEDNMLPLTCSFTPDGRYIAVGTKHVHVYDVASSRCVHAILSRPQEYRVHSVRFVENARYLVYVLHYNQTFHRHDMWSKHTKIDHVLREHLTPPIVDIVASYVSCTTKQPRAS